MTPDAYRTAVLLRARIDRLPDGTYFGAVPGFPYIAVSGATPEACRTQLETLLQQEIMRYLQQGIALPTMPEDPKAEVDPP